MYSYKKYTMSAYVCELFLRIKNQHLQEAIQPQIAMDRQWEQDGSALHANASVSDDPHFYHAQW